ncbi:hypothetical protein D3C74_413920 [compost metagenome]
MPNGETSIIIMNGYKNSKSPTAIPQVAVISGTSTMAANIAKAILKCFSLVYQPMKFEVKKPINRS